MPDAEPLFARAVELNAGDWSAAFGLGTALYQQGNVEDALRWWKTARQLDPPNFKVRKRIWMVEHPQRIYPTIDLDWQKGALASGRLRPVKLATSRTRRLRFISCSQVAANGVGPQYPDTAFR
jgi:hypothetical protein